jgi:replicative DNA helicase
LIDVILLRLMRNRHEYYKYKDLISNTVVDPTAVAILDNFGTYYEKFPTHEDIDLTTFLGRFVAWNPGIKEERMAQFRAMFLNAWKPLDDDTRRNIQQELSELHMATSLANLAQRFNDGDVPNLYHDVQNITEDFRKRLNIKVAKFIDTPIGDLLKNEFDDAGLKWRLDALNRCMRPLRPGDFGIVAGRPDKGKTSFLASELSFLAPQLPSERNALWLNNEGPGHRIIPRIYQAALNYSMDDMMREHTAGRLEAAFVALIGRIDRIRVVDVHGMNIGQVETVIEENNAGIVLYDMIDNIHGFGDAARTDLKLEEMYKACREISVKYDCIGLATSQISADGDGEMFPSLSMLKDSKTGKQGACDFQLMIGASNDPNLQGSRYLGLPKNKLRRPGAPGDPRCEVTFDSTRSRFRDLPIGS